MSKSTDEEIAKEILTAKYGHANNVIAEAVLLGIAKGRELQREHADADEANAWVRGKNEIRNEVCNRLKHVLDCDDLFTLEERVKDLYEDIRNGRRDL